MTTRPRPESTMRLIAYCRGLDLDQSIKDHVTAWRGYRKAWLAGARKRNRLDRRLLGER